MRGIIKNAWALYWLGRNMAGWTRRRAAWDVLTAFFTSEPYTLWRKDKS